MTDNRPGVLSLYEEMKMRGVDLSWYEKREQRNTARPISLNDNGCSRLSIYLLKQDGSLWTVKSDGEAYSQVREFAHRVPCDVYLCLKCKTQRAAMPPEHKEGDS